MTDGFSSNASAISETQRRPRCLFNRCMIRSLVLFLSTKKAFPCAAASSFDKSARIWLHGVPLWVNPVFFMFPLLRNTSASTKTQNNFQAKENKDKTEEG